MALPRIVPSKFPTGEVPDGLEVVVDPAHSFPKGALLTLAAGDQQLETIATNPTTAIIFGVSAEGATLGAPDSLADGVVVFKVEKDIEWAAPLVNGSDTRVAVAASDLGKTYGLRKLADGGWAVDKALGTAAYITKVDVGRNLVWFKFTDAVRQIL